METTDFIFKIADKKWEFEEINKLNYQTFVEEIPQHKRNETETLVDKFDAENTYLICIKGKILVGMVAVRGKRPFSLDHKLSDMEKYLPSGYSNLCELRLLVVRKEYRSTLVFKGLSELLLGYCIRKDYDMALISGIISRQSMYKRMGFVPFGPIVGADDVKFQPMYLTEEGYKKTILSKIGTKSTSVPDNINLLPGPVKISMSVKKALARNPMSHRLPEFQEIFEDTRKRIKKLVNVKNVEILNGSGTLANDVIAGQLLQLKQSGLILSNGEFGERLAKNADGFSLKYKHLRLEWGKEYDLNKIEEIIKDTPKIGWIWLAHCETSTGMLNDIEAIQQLCDKYQIKVCLDCISSIATNKLDLSNIYFASLTSGKGLAAFAGLSMVCFNHEIKMPQTAIPRYYNLYNYTQAAGIPFTLPTNLVFALQQALIELNLEERIKHNEKLIDFMRTELNKLGFNLLLPKELSSNSVVTIPLPQNIKSQDIGFELRKVGILISFNSKYLVERNWIQLCLMSNISKETISSLFPVFSKFSPQKAKN